MSREELRCVMDPAMVLLSILMAYIGSYMAISLLEQLRLYQVNIMDADLIQSLTETDDKSSDKNSIDDNTNTNINTKSNEVAVGKTYLFNSKAQMKFAILGTMACAVGGIGIWSMHMISMAAMKLYLKDDRIPIHFHLGLTLLSLFAVIICCIVGMYIACEDLLFAKSKNKIVEEYIKSKSTAEIQKMGKVTNWNILWILLHLSLHRIVLGAMIAAAGICIMHYVGMEGLMFKGIIKWDAGIVTASVLIAIVAAIAAFWVLFRFLSTFCEQESLRVVAAVIFTIAKCGMHYTGMAAASYFVDTDMLQVDHFPSASISQNQVLIGALAASFIVSWMIIMLIFSDLRLSNQILNAQIYKAEDVIGKVKMDVRIVGATASIVKKYQFFKPTKMALMAVQRRVNSTTAKPNQANKLQGQHLISTDKAHEIQEATSGSIV